MRRPDPVSALQCLLFVADEPLSPHRAAEILDMDVKDVPALVEKLARKLEGHGLHVTSLAGGYALATRSEYAEYIQALLEPDPQRLSRQAFEVLAIVAYKQPITRPEIDAVRGVNSSGVINSLIEKDLLRITGRAGAPGRPFLLATTNHFLAAFGLKSLEDLPQLDLPLPDAKASQAQLAAAELAEQAQTAQRSASDAQGQPEDEVPSEAEDEPRQ